MSDFVVFLGDGSTYDADSLVQVRSEDVQKLQNYIQENKETLDRLAENRKAKQDVIDTQTRAMKDQAELISRLRSKILYLEQDLKLATKQLKGEQQ